MNRKLIFISMFLVAGCGEPLCKNKLMYEIQSPKNEYFASVFERDCGATTPLVNVVSVREKNSSIDMEKYDNWIFTAHGETTIKTSWTDDKKLFISYSTVDTNPTQKDLLGEIAIKYEKK